jgi:hydroxymethylglutaryl-CoA reductase (NADPH)
LLNLLNLCTLPFRPGPTVSNWSTPFNLTEQPSEATLNLISNNISLSHPYLRSITLSILPPVFFRSISATAGEQGFLQRSERAVGGFLEGWTNSVGDPVISKWIVVVLCVSMGLNAWLLNAASRNVLQPIDAALAKSTNNEKALQDDKRPTKQPTISVTEDNTFAKTANLFSLNDSESDDDEKHIAAIKKNSRRVRSVTECMQILTDGRPHELLDEEVIALAIQKKIPLYALEKNLKDLERAVKIRRAVVCMFQFLLC